MNKKIFDREPGASETIPCPIHGQDLELKVENGKVIGICRCDVPKNTIAGNTVYERAATTKE